MLLEPAVLANTIPGCEKLEKVGENTYEGQLKIRVGPVQGVFQGKVELTDIQPPDSYHMIINGRGPAGVVQGKGNLALDSEGEMTRMHYDGSVQVSGRIASVGQRLMDSSAKSIVKQCLQNLEQQVDARVAPPAEEGEPSTMEKTVAAPSPLAAPSQTEFMANVTRDIIEDYLPDPQQRRLVLGLGAAVVAISLFNAFANLIARRVARILKED